MQRLLSIIILTSYVTITVAYAEDSAGNLASEASETSPTVNNKLRLKMKKKVVRDPLLTDAPLLSDFKYFEYSGLNARKVTVRSILGFNRPYIMHAYNENPRGVYDFICLMVLVEKSLQGVDVELMSIKERHDMASALITIFLRKYGYITELDKFLDSHNENYILPAETLCRITSDITGAILDEHNHVQTIFDKVSPTQ